MLGFVRARARFIVMVTSRFRVKFEASVRFSTRLRFSVSFRVRV